MKSKGFQGGRVGEEYHEGKGSEKGYWMIFLLVLQGS